MSRQLPYLAELKEYRTSSLLEKVAKTKKIEIANQTPVYSIWGKITYDYMGKPVLSPHFTFANAMNRSWCGLERGIEILGQKPSYQKADGTLRHIEGTRTFAELKKVCKDNKVRGYTKMTKAEMATALQKL